MQQYCAQPHGFTLLECILYIALFSFFIETSIGSVAAFSESIERSKTKTVIENEKEFLINKINYEVRDANFTLTSTSTATTSTDILIDNSKDLYFEEDALFIKYLNGSPIQISDSFIHITNGSFSLTGSSTLKSFFVISEKTNRGETISEKVELSSTRL